MRFLRMQAATCLVPSPSSTNLQAAQSAAVLTPPVVIGYCIGGRWK